MAEIQLSESQARELAQFAAGLYAGERFNYWSPFQSNEIMQNLNSNGKRPTADKIRSALANYRENAETLQDYSEFMQHFDMIFARTIKMYVNALSYDVVPVCINATKASDYESPEYEKDKARIDDFLTKFKYQKEFRLVTENVVTSETFYTWFRKTKWKNQGMKYALQIMPQKYCITDGYWEKGLLYSFDMSYFLNPGTDLDLYDPTLKKYYNQVYGQNQSLFDYRPSTPLATRDGKYAYYVQTSPVDGSWVFKMDMSDFNNTPFIAPFLKSAIDNDTVQVLQASKDAAEAYGIIAGQIGTFDNAKSGTKQDQTVFTSATIGRFMGLAKKALKDTKVAALPMENIKWFQYQDSNADMYSNQLANSAAIGTGVSRVIYSSDRMSNAEIEAGLNEMYETMKPLYDQFSNFLEFYAGQITKKYKWQFIFPNGSNYPHKRKEYFDNLVKCADKGLVLPPAMWASGMGVNPVLFERMLAQSKYTGWVDEYSQLMANTNTATGANEGGRPKKEDGDLSDSGELNRDSEEGI